MTIERALLVARLETRKRCTCGYSVGYPGVSSCSCDLAVINDVLATLSALEAERDALRLALVLAKSGLPDSEDAGPDADGYRWAWDELTGEEQAWVKALRERIAAALAQDQVAS